MASDLNVFVLAASLRDGSINRRLADLVADRLRDRDVEAEVESFGPFDTPSFDQDVEQAEGLPEGAERLARRLLDADAFVIAAPEYNHSVPGYLKNTIDWVSRHPDKPLDGHLGLLVAASPSLVGGDRGLLALRVPLETLGAQLHPTHFALAQAHRAYADDGSLADEAISAMLDRTLDRFVDRVRAIRSGERRDERRRDAA